ncbi:MAG: hypothetical protein OXC93_05070 [Rhodospirillaceae bacterium]|nr:hypothetical protein [Rhodospirillaceae bacterium]
MADGELDEAYRQFGDELLLEAEFSGDTQHMCFFKLFSEVASDNGDTADMEYTPVLREGRGGYQIDGYAIDLDRGELFLAVCAFNNDSTLRSLNAVAMEALFRRVDSFCEKAVDPEFVREIEETSPAFQAAYPIFENRRKIRRIRVILLTNAVLAVRRKMVDVGKTVGLPVAYNVLDFARYIDILKSRGNVEPIEIDATIDQWNAIALFAGPCPRNQLQILFSGSAWNIPCRYIRFLRSSIAGTERQGVPAGADESEQRYYRYCPGIAGHVFRL